MYTVAGAVSPLHVVAAPVEMDGSWLDMLTYASFALALAAFAVVVAIWRRFRRSRVQPFGYLYRLERGRLVKFGVTTDVCRIGRHPNNELQIDHGSVSRFHAELVRNRNGTFSIVDTDSKNGIRVGFRPVNSCLVREGDIIDVGSIRFKFTRYPRDYNVHENTVMLDTTASRFDLHRRRAQRQDVAMHVRIYNDESGWINGRVRNLGPDGAFVETDRNLSPRVPIDMVFPFIDGKRRRWMRLSGEVVREDNQGIGISFTDNDAGVRQFLASVTEDAA